MTAGDPPAKPSTAPEAAVDKSKPSSSSVPQLAATAAEPATDGPPPVVKKRRGRPPGSKTKKRHKGLLAGAGSLYANLTGLGPSDPSGFLDPSKAYAGANGSSGDQSLLAKHNPNIIQPHKHKQQKGLHLAIMDTIACLQPADVGTPFASLADACDRLFPYHAVFEENFVEEILAHRHQVRELQFQDTESEQMIRVFHQESTHLQTHLGEMGQAQEQLACLEQKSKED